MKSYQVRKHDMWLPEGFFRQHLLHLPVVTVDLVARDGQRRFLLVKRNQNNLTWRGMWATPGGRVFRNEKILDAAHRVLLRETSLNLPRSKFKFRGFHEQFAPKEHGVTMIFSAKAHQRKIKWDKTSSSARWFRVSDTPKSLRCEFRDILHKGGVKFTG